MRPMSGRCATGVTPGNRPTLPERHHRPYSVWSVRCERESGRIPGANLAFILLLSSTTWTRTEPRCKRSRNFAKKPNEKSSVISWRFSTKYAEWIPPKNWRVHHDNILRILAGVTSRAAVVLKIAYHGPRAMEELAQYDSEPDCRRTGRERGHHLRRVKLIHDARNRGTRALFGRKINTPSTSLRSSRCCGSSPMSDQS